MIIPDGYAQVNLRWEGTPVPTGAESTFGIRLDDAAESPTSLAMKVEAQFSASGIMAPFTQDISITNIHVKFGPDSTGPFADLPVSIEGESADAAVPSNTALLIRKHTGFGGRAGRGRMYWPGLPETKVGANGNVDSALRTLVGDKLDDIRSGLALNDAVMVLLHGAGSPLSSPSVITSTSIDAKAATQRRRLRR